MRPAQNEGDRAKLREIGGKCGIENWEGCVKLKRHSRNA